MSQSVIRIGFALGSLLCLIATWQVFGSAAKSKLGTLLPAYVHTTSVDTAPPAKNLLDTSRFLQAGLDSARTLEDKIEIVDFGLERAPRDLSLWMVRTELALQQEDWEKAVYCLDKLYYLDDTRGDLYLEALLGISKNATGRHTIADFVTPDTRWARKLIWLMAGTGSNSQELLVISPKVQGGVQPLLNAFVRQGDYERAFLAWLDALKTEDQVFTGWPFNPDFQPSDIAHPFNWKLGPGAEYDGEAGVYIRYNGTGKPRLVSQAMLLGPGTYTLTITARAYMEPSGGHMRWQLSCVADKTITPFQLDVLPTEFTPASSQFTIPASNCPVQLLTLSGVPGAYPEFSRMILQSVEIEPAAMTGATQ